MATANFNTNRRRGSRRQIEQRRLGVWEMLCCGQPVSEIASSFGVSERTIERDIRWWQERLGQSADDLKNPDKAAIDVGMAAKKLDKIFEDAYVEYCSASNPTVKVRFLQTAIQSIVVRHKILADAGYLPRVGHERETPPSVQITFEQRFGKNSIESVFDDPKSRRRVLDAAFSVLKAGMDDHEIAQLPFDAMDAELRESKGA